MYLRKSIRKKPAKKVKNSFISNFTSDENEEDDDDVHDPFPKLPLTQPQGDISDIDDSIDIDDSR